MLRIHALLFITPPGNDPLKSNAAQPGGSCAARKWTSTFSEAVES